MSLGVGLAVTRLIEDLFTRADWLGYSLGSLLGLAWPGYDAQRDALSPDYRWQAPPHPVVKDASDFTR